MRAFQQVSPLNLGATDDEWIFWWGMIQHYSGFSRVLDWTGSPDVALYFATKEPMDKPGRVWALNLSKIPEPPECFAECPPNLPAALLEQHPILENGVPFFIHRCTVRKRQTRVSAQKGWFTTCSDVLVDHKEAVQRVTNAGSNALEHFDVPKEEKAGTLTWLGSKGILGARLFADAPDGMGYSQIQSVVAEYCRTKAPGS